MSDLISEKELAQRWQLTAGALANQRSTGRGIPYVRVGRIIRYRMSDVLAAEQLIIPGNGA